MSRRKPAHSPSKPREFSSKPFGALKQVTVAETVAKPVAGITTQVAPLAPVEKDDRDLFLEAMGGVCPLEPPPSPGPQGARRLIRDSVREQRHETTEPVRPDPLFLEEIGRLRLEVSFRDSLPDDGELTPLSGNRLRQLKRGTLTISRQLDLHGLTRHEALEELPRFLRTARSKGEKAVLVITGKGANSEDGPVLQRAVTSWLREAGRQLVAEFAPAPREMGGSGALVVFLRGLLSKGATGNSC